MNRSIFPEIARVIKEVHNDGRLIASLAEEAPYEKEGKVMSQMVIRVLYGTTIFDSISREKVEGPSYHGSVADGSIIVKLYHIDDFIRFISEGDIAFFNFLYNNPEKQSDVMAKYDYCIHPFEFFKVNRDIFVSKMLVESTISQAWSFFEDAVALSSQDTPENSINANIFLSQGIQDVLRVIDMEYDGTDKWSLEYPYKDEKTFKIIAAIANGRLPWSELLTFYKKKINELEQRFQNNINLPEDVNGDLLEQVVKGFYIEYLSS